MFKVVKTIENGEPYYSAVPESWEQNGTLFWPPIKASHAVDKLRREKHSFPLTSWSRSPCTIKFRDIPSYGEAIRLEKSLVDCSDTEAESFMLQKRRRTNNDGKPVEGTRMSFDGLFDDPPILNPVPAKHEESAQEESRLATSATFTTNQVTDTHPAGQFGLSDVISSIFQLPPEPVSEETADGPLVATLDPATQRLLAGMDVKLDEILKIMRGTSSRPHIEEFNPGVIFPIKEQTDVRFLNDKLANEEYNVKFVDLLSKVNGTSGKGKGSKAAYLLSDYIFDRNLLTEYSWTGHTKCKDSKKASFEQYSNLIEAFGKIVRLADSGYTVSDNQGFFKDKILKYADSRVKQKKILKKEKMVNVCDNP